MDLSYRVKKFNFNIDNHSQIDKMTLFLIIKMIFNILSRRYESIDPIQKYHQSLPGAWMPGLGSSGPY